MGERHETSLQDAYLDAALEERVGNTPPPDLTEQILSAAQQQRTSTESVPATQTPRRWQGFLVAAMLLVGALITLGVWWLKNGEGDKEDQVPIQDPRLEQPQQDPKPEQPKQDPNQDPKQHPKKPSDPKAVEPRSLPECKRLLRQVTRITVRQRTVGKHRLPAKIPGGPNAPEVVLFTGGEPLKKAIDGFVACIKPGLASVKWQPPNDLYLYLPDGRRLVAQLEETDPGSGWLTIQGVGIFEAQKPLLDAMRAVLVAGEISTKTDLGILLIEDLGTDPKVTNYGCLQPSAKHVRAHGFKAGDVVKLSRYRRLESVDLRWSEAAHTDADMHALSEMRSLRKLYLNASKVTRRHLEMLSNLAGLQELFLLGANEKWNDDEIQSSADKVDDVAVDHIVKMTRLTRLVVPDSQITEIGLFKMQKLQNLEVLVLTNNQYISGTGFEFFRGLKKFRELYLAGCKNLMDAGFVEIGKLPHLEEVYLQGVRDPKNMNTPKDRLTPSCLEHLAKAPKLKRVFLDGWFRRLTNYGRLVYVKKWRKPLRTLVTKPGMYFISLHDCGELQLDDLKFCFKGADSLGLLVLSKTLGAEPWDKASERDLKALSDVIPKCTFVFGH